MKPVSRIILLASITTFILLLGLPGSSAWNDRRNYMSPEKMLYLHISKAGIGLTLDFDELADAMALSRFRETINENGLRGFANFIQGLSPDEHRKLTALSSGILNGMKPGFRDLTNALGEGDNWVWFPKTTKFGWHLWTFMDKLREMSNKYGGNLEVRYKINETFGTHSCPCELCIQNDDSGCVDVGEDKLHIAKKYHG
ncbi:hypothetical protein DdX_17454 [Ditylenchus destructor]|uniref:Uncharacterized protein n=1 Tax=Ditylenchus destructor TaxID=166010 RepID=A0AAD4QVS2_9BILA|nr:hypothetical protein DdX_17454 [Ditylenchus destructor]